MQRDQADDRARDQQHVQRVEARERVTADLGAAVEELREELADERRRPVQVDADDGRPVGRLVPRQQVAGEALEHAEDEQHHADDPVQLARVLVGAEQETRAVWKNSRMMKTLAPQRCMPRTSQPSVRSFVMYWIDAYAVVGRGL